MTGEIKRPLTALIAAAVLVGGFAAGAATAKEHGEGWRGDNPRSEGRGPPPWSHAGGRGQAPAYGGRRGYAPPPGHWGRQAPPDYAVPAPYGPPPGYGAEAYSPRGYGVRRGGYLPPDLRGGMLQDYGRYRLRPPPRGYGWVRVGGGYALVETESGQIFDIVPY